MLQVSGPHAQSGWDFPEEILENFRKHSGNVLRAFPGILLESTTGIPKPYNSGHLRLPEISRIPSPSVQLRAALFQSGFGEDGLSKPVMEFPPIQGAFLTRFKHVSSLEASFGQDFYQTYARTSLSAGFFPALFCPKL